MAASQRYVRTMTPFVDPAGFAEWEAGVPEVLRRDPIWRTPAYRYGLWLADLARADARRLYAIRESRNTADQLIRATEAISSNLAEGYGCLSGPERVRYYGYALRSCRESFDWYFKARDVLGLEVVERRFEILDRLVRILTAVIPRERRRNRRDRPPPT
jgi:four helix bundle protein